MNSPMESTYGFVRLDERYKKLERTIKMMQMKQYDKKMTESSIPDSGPNVSSINGDMLDSSCAYSSKFGSEVVSSSTNMRNIISQKLKSINNGNNIATSSVKECANNDVQARAIMPPPKSIGILAHSSRRSSSAAGIAKLQHQNRKNNSTELGSHFSPPNPSIISSIKCSSSVHESMSPKYTSDGQDSEKKRRNHHSDQPDRIFERWKVILNDKGQLIIKGTLKDSERIVRSKPVIRRLSAVSVQSCFNHIYELQGRIYADTNDLPEYVHGKFYNGFPDDWENVYQLWRSYVSEGCKPSFRWPTPIADSDDDLKSDITEITFHKEEGITRSRTSSYKNRSESPETSEKWSNRTSVKQVARSPVKKPNNQSLSPSKFNSLPPSKGSSSLQANKGNESLEKPQNKSGEANNLTEQALNSFIDTIHDRQLNNTVTSDSAIDEDIFSAVSKILTNKNCSIQYIEKIIEMFNCYKYVIMSKRQPENPSPSVTADSQISSTKSALANNFPNLSSIKSGIENCTLRVSNHQNQFNNQQSFSRDSGNVSKMSAENSSVKNQSNVRRKLSRRDYDSTEVSETDSQVEKRNKTPRKVQRSFNCRRKSLISSASRSSPYEKREIVQYQTRRKLANDSEDDDVANKISHQKHKHNDDYSNDQNKHKNVPEETTQVRNIKNAALKKPHEHKEVRNFDTELFKKSHQHNEARNSKHVNPLSRKHFQDRATSPSTITGFLVDYDSCVSISEDDRRVKQNYRGNPLIDNKFERNEVNADMHHYYDSSASFTEDEVKETKSMQVTEAKKQILQESNQDFAATLKRNLNHNSDNIAYFDKKRPTSHTENREIKEKPLYNKQNDQDVPFISDSALSNGNKENKLMGNGKRKQLNEHVGDHEDNQDDISDELSQSLRKRKMPIIVSVENVSLNVDPLLSTHCHADNEVIKAKKPILDSFEEDQRAKSSGRSREKNSNEVTPLDLSSKSQKSEAIKCRELSIKLQDIKATLKDKHREEKKATTEKGTYGSEGNPKSLSNWVPVVVEKVESEYALVFEGNLLNEAGHVVNKKFTTDFIKQRVSLKVVETEHGEFYQLVGDMTDTKHTVPKKLHKFCFSGCPAKILQFCRRWRSIILENFSVSQQQPLNATIDIMNIPQSSRGRRILPPLCYWNGERVTIKDNQTVYCLGNSQDSLVSGEISKKDLSQNSSRSRNTSVKDTTTSTRRSNEKENKVKEVKDKERHNNRNPRQEMDNERNVNKQKDNYEEKGDNKRQSVKNMKEQRKLRKTTYRSRSERRKVDRISDSSSDENHPLPKRLRRAENANNNKNENEIKLQSNRRLREKKNENNTELKESNGVTYRYYKRVINKKNELSDDESSN